MIDDNVEMFTSTVWLEIRSIIDARISACLNKLANAKDYNEVLKLQGNIEALKSLRALEISAFKE